MSGRCAWLPMDVSGPSRQGRRSAFVWQLVHMGEQHLATHARQIRRLERLTA